MRESCSYGSVGERGGDEPLYPDKKNKPLQVFISQGFQNLLSGDDETEGAIPWLTQNWDSGKYN